MEPHMPQDSREAEPAGLQQCAQVVDLADPVSYWTPYEIDVCKALQLRYRIFRFG
jgi:hypothetical protein